MARLTAADRAYEYILRKILSLDLQPGAVIDEKALSEELQLSRGPIREGLKRLDQENLVTIVPRKGTFVTDVSLADFYAIFELRAELEGFAAYLAAERANGQTLKRFERLLADAEKFAFTDHNEIDLEIEIDLRFHHLVYDAAANDYLKKTLEELLSHSLRLFNLSQTRSAPIREEIPDYQAIYECFAQRDADRARRWMQEHVLESGERIRSSFAMHSFRDPRRAR